METTLLLLIISACLIGYVLLSEVLVPRRSNEWPGTKYRQPKSK